jgi:hypothetical protein
MKKASKKLTNVYAQGHQSSKMTLTAEPRQVGRHHLRKKTLQLKLKMTSFNFDEKTEKASDENATETCKKPIRKAHTYSTSTYLQTNRKSRN